MLSIGIEKLEDFEKIVKDLGDNYAYYTEKIVYPLKECELTTIDRIARVKYTYSVCQSKDKEEATPGVAKIREAAKKMGAFQCRFIDDSIMTYTPEV